MAPAATADLLSPVAAAEVAGFGLPLRPLPRPADEPGWRTAQTLADDPALLQDLLGRGAAALGSPSGAGLVAATTLIEAHAWYVAATALGGVLLHGRIPPLEPLLLRDGPEGWVNELALPAHGWERGGGAELAVQLETHLAPVVAALAPHRRPKPLWRSVGDRLGQAAIWCGTAFEADAQVLEIATDALSAPTALRAPARFTVQDGVPFRRRTGCCLTYRTAEAVHCDDCSLIRP